MKSKAIIVSGYFNPINKGLIEYFKNAKGIGDKLIAVLSSDHQKALKNLKMKMSEF